MDKTKKASVGRFLQPNNATISFNVSKRHKERLMAQYDEWCVKEGYFEADTKPSFSMWLAFEKLKLTPEMEDTKFDEISAADKRDIFKMTREFLIIAADTKEVKGVPKQIRAMAEKILEYFPNDMQVLEIIPNEILDDEIKTDGK